MANEYLTRTPTSTGNRKVWTWSGWIKLSNTSSTSIIRTSSSGTSAESGVYFNSSKVTFEYYNGSGQNYYTIESSLRRDFSSWSHVLVSCDSTKVDLENERTVIYVNGIRTSSLSADVPLPVNTDTFLNLLGRQVNIGSRPVSSADQFFLGEMCDFFFVDGQALTPDVFGFYKVGKGYISAGSTQSTDFRPGQWVPKTPRVIKTAINNNGGFGVNGFYLPMNDSNNFGADFHCDPNSIIKLQENLPQPKCRIDGVGDYTGALRADPYAANLVLALPFVSGGLSSGFGDYSAAIKGSGTPKTMSSGSVSIASTASYYGSSANFQNSNSYVDTPGTSGDFNMGTGDFTVEGWFYPTGNGGNARLFGQNTNAANAWDVYINGSSATGQLYMMGATYQLTTASIQGNQWNHVAISRKNLVWTTYLNGVAAGIVTSITNNTVGDSANKFRVGQIGENAYGGVGYGFQGYIQDLRIYKGVAKYTGGFDVPRPYTPVGIATWRAVPDSPANNFCTWNPLNTGGSTITFTSGNLDYSTSSGNTGRGLSTFLMRTGKWYCELRATNNNYNHPGIYAESISVTSDSNRIVYRNDGNVYRDGSLLATIVSFNASGDIIGMTFDADTRQLTYYKNGVLIGGPYTPTDPGTGNGFYFHILNGNAGVTSGSINFGQNPTFSGNTTAGTYADTNGKGLFKYQPPSGFLALCEDNLPTPAIANPGRHFRTVLWTGDGASGRSITGVGFTPDLVWIKERTSTSSHALFDSVRGAGKRLTSNSTDAEQVGFESVYNPAFNYDGFSLGNDGAINELSQTYVAWCWRAGAGTTSTNTNGSITSVVSVNQDAGFSIVSWTGTAASATVGHGLGKAPGLIILKNRDDGTRNWPVYHKSFSIADFIYLNLTNAKATDNSTWGTTNSSIFTLGNGATPNTSWNANGQRFIAYCWAEIEGYSKFGSYTGNGSTDGPFVYCGFKPAWVMIKNISGSHNWEIYDSSMNPINPVGLTLLPNTSDIQTDTTPRLDFLSNGFKWRNIGGSVNGSGNTIIFAAYAESPFQTANAK